MLTNDFLASFLKLFQHSYVKMTKFINLCKKFIVNFFRDNIQIFWEKNPALFYGLILFLGYLFALQTPWVLIPCILLFYKKRFFQASIVFLFPCCIVYQFYSFPTSESHVEGIFYIHSIKKNEKFGGIGWNYKGVLQTIDGRIFCHCFSKDYSPPNKAYKVKGSIYPLNGKFYSLKSKESWEFAKDRFTLATHRACAQDYVKAYIEKHISQKRTAYFLQGMITGQLEDRVMMHEFNQLGLSHLMAISGLHFSILSLIFHVFLRLFLPQKIESICMIILLTTYLLFLGDSPSVLRSWISSMIFFGGQILEKRSSALNSLGTALLFSLIWDPLSALTLSFQLSFLATGGILLFYSPCDRLLCYWLPKYSLKDALIKHWMHQHFYIFTAFFRKALALTLAVHITLFLLLLKTFHVFSFNSLFYNLFFPLLASIALIFFLVSILLGHWAHVINSYYCDIILRIAEQPPLIFKTIYAEEIPACLCTLFFTGLLIIILKNNTKTQKLEHFLIY